MRRLWVVMLSSLCVGTASAQEFGFRGWGPRVGLADDPDQVVVGAHFDLGEFADHLRFVPNVEAGFGDDHTILSFTAPVHYRWEELGETNVIPYAGGGVSVAWIHPDDDGPGNDDDDDLDLGLRAVGGAEWPLAERRAFFVELNVVFGDVHDFQVVAGWTFPAGH
jgi:hypothetical protein